MGFADGDEKTTSEPEEMHVWAHRYCFIAHALNCSMDMIL